MRDFKNVKRVVLKIGSSSLVNSDLSVNKDMINKLMASFRSLKDSGYEIVLVTSGAIALGRHELKLKAKPKTMAMKQACAAVGQAKLMDEYNKTGEQYGIVCGQILLNHDDFQKRDRLNFLADCLEECLRNGVVPIINENDALAVEEIKVGDNDTLSSLIVPVIDADLLILFSDIDGLYNKNPKEFSDAYLIDKVTKIDDSILAMAGLSSTSVGTGGMKTKLNAAIISTNASCNMIICNSNRISDLEQIVKGEEIGTLFVAKNKGISLREHWMIFITKAVGSIIVDKGLEKALADKKVSILPKGILGTAGSFLENSIVNIVTEDGKVIAKGITNYSSAMIEAIKGINTYKLKAVSANITKNEVMHANNMVMVKEDLLC